MEDDRGPRTGPAPRPVRDPGECPWYSGRMSVLNHIYDVPSEDELAQLVGAATPHFALQIRNRVAGYVERLPKDHPRQAELAAHMERLEQMVARDRLQHGAGPGVADH